MEQNQTPHRRPIKYWYENEQKLVGMIFFNIFPVIILVTGVNSILKQGKTSLAVWKYED